MTKTYECDVQRHAINLVMDYIRKYVDKWAHFSKAGIAYQINTTGTWEKRTLSFKEAARISEEAWPRI